MVHIIHIFSDKNQHPAHPFEEKMKDVVSSNYNFSNPLLDANKIDMRKKTNLMVPGNSEIHVDSHQNNIVTFLASLILTFNDIKLADNNLNTLISKKRL